MRASIFATLVLLFGCGHGGGGNTDVTITLRATGPSPDPATSVENNRVIFMNADTGPMTISSSACPTLNTGAIAAGASGTANAGAVVGNCSYTNGTWTGTLTVTAGMPGYGYK